MAKSRRLQLSKLSREDLAIAHRLRSVREGEDFSLSEFARETDLERSTLVNYEHGVTPLPFEIALRICDRLDLSLRWLATGVEPEIPFASLDEIKVSGLSLAPSSTLSGVYPEHLASACDAWFEANPTDLLVERQLRGGPIAVVRRVSDRQLFRFVREWLADFRKRPVTAVSLAILGNVELAVQEMRSRTEKKIGRKISSCESVQVGTFSPVQIEDDIKKARGVLGMNQKEAAAHWGIPVSTLRKWEGGHAAPRGLALRQLETILRTAEKSSD